MRSPNPTLQLRCIPGLLLAVGLATAAPRAIAVPLFAAPYLSFDTGRQPVSEAIGDVNGDGIPDIVTANYGPNTVASTVSVLLGSGYGTFGARTDFGVGIHPTSVAIGDLNGDGFPDI